MDTAARRVIVTTDFSDLADRALPHARRLAAALDARADVLFVVEGFRFPGGWDIERAEGSGGQARLMARVDAALNTRVQQLRADDGPDAAPLTRVGKVADTIAEAAGTPETEALVMATHGYGGFRRFLLGAVVVKVLRATRCPTLVVPSEAEDRPISTVLLPVDVDGLTERVLPQALKFAAAWGAEVVLFHALEPSWSDVFAEVPEAAGLSGAGAMRVDQAREVLDTYADQARQAGLAARIELGHVRRVAPGIVDIAGELEVGAIVMPAHGRSGFERLMLGSVTEEVIRRSEIPVLVLQPDSAS